jgi:hypothetical protein
MSITYTFDQLISEMTVKEAREKIYTIAAKLGLAVTSWKAGAWFRTVFSAQAIIEAANSRYVSLIAKSGFWQLSEGPWLTLCAKYLTGVLRREPSFASGYVVLTNSGANDYTDTAAEDVTVANRLTGKTFKNSEVFTLAPYGTATVLFTAEQSGSGSSSAPGTITTLVTSMPGVTCTNPASLVGQDEEGDPSVQARCDRRAQSLSVAGARAAYLHFAMFDVDGMPLRRPDGGLVDVNRATVSDWSVVADVTVIVAGASGAVTGTWDDPTTDLGAIYLNIERHVVTFGVRTLTVNTTQDRALSFGYELIVDQTISRTDDELYTAVETALSQYLATVPIGGYKVGEDGFVFALGVRAAMKSVDAKILDVELDALGDFGLFAYEIPIAGVLNRGGITRIRAT